MRLQDRISIVTGAGRGIGKATSLAFAREGSDVMTVDILPQTAEITSKEIRALGRKSLSFEMDVSNGRQVREMVKTVMDTFGRIDILANVAGIFMKSAIADVSEQDWDRVMEVNLKGTFLCSQAIGKEMIKQNGGSIVNFASIAANTPQLYSGAYSPSKAGVLLLTKLMAVEWVKHNIRVNALSPGPIKTPMTDAIYNTDALRKARARAIPMDRFGSPEEVARAVVFLVSDEASFVTGESFVIDGGSMSSIYYVAGLLSG